MPYGYDQNKEALQKRLRRIEGQVRGLQRMVDEDRYCINILEQVSATTRALQAVALELLDGHLMTCVADAVKVGGDEATGKINEASAAIAAIGALLTEIGHGLRESFLMFWETLWPLVLGFGLSGAVQAFVSRDAMSRSLGHLRPSTVTRASLYGMASSSCSYAASALSKSLFAGGADFVAANVFMFASTNLVIELGVVLVALMGWQFAASEFVGGFIMIVLLATLGSLWLRGRQVMAARAELNASTDPGSGHDDPPPGAPVSWPVRLRSKAGWADASAHTMSDLTMVRRELVVGYLLAGFLTALVPEHAWNILFVHGHGFWTSLENVTLGPFIALISCVCSVGNVPLAAALWHGGISFGGVISFIFADLIALPLLLIYRRYYGTRLALRMLGLFWAVMAVAGLLTEVVFRTSGLVPASRAIRIPTDGLSWNYTTYLNIVFLALLGLIYWMYRNRGRFGPGDRLARDPVCGMQVEMAQAPAARWLDGEPVYFCSDRCRDSFGVETAIRQPATSTTSAPT